MYSLVFDTTAAGVALALYKDKTQVCKIEYTAEFGQAEFLAATVADVLKKNKLKFKDIELLGVCTGPGSFTGVRSGLAFARGLAFGTPELKITGVSAFDVYAKMFKKEALAFYNAVVIETKREDFYFQLFDEKLDKLTPPLALDREDIIKQLKGRQVSFIGDGVERLLSVSTGLQIKSVELSDMTTPEALFEAVYQKYSEKNLDFPKPLYIRNAEACVK